MERLQRSLWEWQASLAPLELKVDFMDQDGVLQRSISVTKRMLMRGATVGKLEYLSMESNVEAGKDKPQSSAEVENLDSVVETTSRSTVRTPSPTSQTYVDEDCNLRRKSSISPFAESFEGLLADDQTKAAPDTSASNSQAQATQKALLSPVTCSGQRRGISDHPADSTSLVFEFAQNFIDT